MNLQIDDVVVDGKRQVGNHGEHVWHGNACEDHVGGCPHVWSVQDDDVEDVADGAYHAHKHG